MSKKFVGTYSQGGVFNSTFLVSSSRTKVQRGDIIGTVMSSKCLVGISSVASDMLTNYVGLD